MNGLKRGYVMITGAATDSATAYKQTAIYSLDKLEPGERLAIFQGYCSQCGNKRVVCDCDSNESEWFNRPEQRFSQGNENEIQLSRT
jgi:translation elongation factor EF-Tu-like GTPase